MKTRHLIPRRQAERDVDAAIEYYLREGGENAGSSFLDAIHDAFQSITDHPEAGSPRLAETLGIAGVRTWRVRRYPYLVIYIVTENLIDVWRVLHVQRDIPTRLADPAA